MAQERKFGTTWSCVMFLDGSGFAIQQYKWTIGGLEFIQISTVKTGR